MNSRRCNDLLVKVRGIMGQEQASNVLSSPKVMVVPQEQKHHVTTRALSSRRCSPLSVNGKREGICPADVAKRA